MAFPINPSPGDSYTDGYGTVWIYAGAVNGWYRQQVSTPNDTSYTAAISGPAGSNTQVQFNDNGELAGDSGLTYNKTTDALSGGAFIPTGSTVPTNGVYRPSANNVAISTNGTGRLFVDASGNVGVGNGLTSPQRQLHVLAPVFGANLTGGFRYGDLGNNYYVDQLITTDGSSNPFVETKFASHTLSKYAYGGGSNYWEFYTNNSPRMRLDSSGRLGLGTSSPSNTLHVVGTGLIADANNGINLTLTKTGGFGSALQLQNTSGLSSDLIRILDSSNNIISQIQPATNGINFATGHVGVGTTSPTSPFTVRTPNGNEAQAEFSGAHTGRGLKLSTGAATLTDALVIYDAQTSTGQHAFNIAGTEALRIDNSRRLLVGTSSTPISSTAVLQGRSGATTGEAILRLCRGQDTPADAAILGDLSFGDSNNGDAARIFAQRDGGTWTSASSRPSRLVFSTTADGGSSPTERMRIANDGAVVIGKTSVDDTTAGFAWRASQYFSAVRSGGAPGYINRLTNDGTLLEFAQDSTTEGTISVSGTTVSYNGAHLSRWSQLPSGAERIEILRGSVLSNIDEMCEWDDEENEQLNRMKVSDVEGDKNVSGVFQAWDDDDDTYTNDFYCAMTGDFIIRIGAGVTVERGDLLMSAGDGTAKPQDDDIIRSKTIAKVTSTNVSCTYEDGSYCVPCVLMAC